MELLLYSIQASLIITAVYMMLKDGMLLGFFRPHLEKIESDFVRKPLFECIICMASIWGLISWFLFFGGWSWDIPQYLLMTCGINTLISYFMALTD